MIDLAAVRQLHTYWLRQWIVDPTAESLARLNAARDLERTLIARQAAAARSARWPYSLRDTDGPPAHRAAR